MTLFRGHFAPGQNDVQRSAVTDQTWQSDGSTIHQGNPPTPAVNTHVGITRHHPDVTPQCNLHSSGNGRPLYCSDYGFGQSHSSRTHRTTGYEGMTSGFRIGIGRQRIWCVHQCRGVFEVPSGTECATGTKEHRHRHLGIVFKFFERGI